MAKVQVLDEHLSNLIAAGEVVLDPKSVIKELIENSLDASASIITIELIDAGYKMIKISDNGHGMNEHDAKLCIKRHATSKIKTVSDLNQINTMGFRGEALPSIASVSHFSLATGTTNSNCSIKIQGGNIIEINENAQPLSGTTICVQNLFYNTPARLKHQVTQRYMFSQIKEYIQQMSLIKPQIKFNLIHNDVNVFNSISGDKISNVAQIFGVEVAKNMINVDFEDMDFTLKGFFVDPKYAKNNKKSMLMSINKRLIWSNNLANGIIDGLSSFLMVKKYPICYLDIEVDPSLIDVNVHPQKKLVKISKEDKLVTIIKEVISQTMTSNISLFNVEENSTLITSSDTNRNIKKTNYEAKPLSFLHEELNQSSTNISHDTTEEVVFNDSLCEEEFYAPQNKNYEANISLENKTFNLEQTKDLSFNQVRNDLTPINYIGQFNDSYIIASQAQKLILIDQHAAMERINYEKNLMHLKMNEKYVVKLALPLSFDFSTSEIETIDQQKELLNKVAIKYEIFGTNTLLIRQVPSFINSAKAKKFFDLIFAKILNTHEINFEMLIDEIAIIKACKMSLKANQKIDNYEANKLISQLYFVKNYTTCPHGRPLIVRISLTQIEKWFKRIV